VLAAAAPVLAGRLLVAVDRRRRAHLAAALPAIARAVADALAGGHSIRGAFAVAAAEGAVTGPAGQELRAVRAALVLGEDTDAVLDRLRGRAAHPAFDALVAAVLLQRESGGDLATLLRTIATTVEEQVRVEADARAMTAQARFTAVLVAALPALAAAVAELASPGYLGSLLSRPLTAWLAAMSIVLQGAAWLAVRRISRVRR
jgi:tight adherence protein B